MNKVKVIAFLMAVFVFGVVQGNPKTIINDVNLKNSNLKKDIVYIVDAVTVPSSAGIIVGAGNYNEGETVTLSVSTNVGYTFIDWMVNGVTVSSSNSYTFIVTSDLSIVANFRDFLDEPVVKSFTDFLGGHQTEVDYNNDGLIDVVRTGITSTLNRTIIYKNEGDGTFTPQMDILLKGIYGDTYWGDIDNDGDMDVILNGLPKEGGSAITKVYLNDGSNVFTEITGTDLPDLYNGTIALGDYNNDGFVDVFLSGWDGVSNISRVFKNNGNYTFTEVASLDSYYPYFSAEWGDYDNDGDLDLLLSSSQSSVNFNTRVYRNDNNNFVLVEPIVDSNLGGIAKWGDYDNDGDLDILLFAKNYESTITSTRIYKNIGNSQFEYQSSIPLSNNEVYYLNWADINNDGLLDVVMVEYDSGINFTVFFNNGDNSFTKFKKALYTNYLGASIFDYNNDNNLDFILSEYTYSAEYKMSSYNNILDLKNTKPSEPSNLQAILDKQKVTFKWDKSTDSQTPSDGLNYNLYVYKVGDAKYIKAPYAFPQSDANNGKKLIPESGYIQWSEEGYSLNNFSAGSYKWSVQSVDGGFLGSSFASENSFTIVDYDVTAAVLPVDGGTVSGTRRYIKGTTATLIAVPALGMVFDNWTEDGNIISSDPTFSFEVTTDRNLVANFTQQFMEVLVPFAQLSESSAAWGDYDNDTYLDLLISGIDESDNLQTKVYHNNGDGTFTELAGTEFSGVRMSSVAWADVNNDGKLDVLVFGSNISVSSFSNIYINKGDGTFIAVVSSGLPNQFEGSILTEDFNNDGKVDIILSESFGEYTKVFLGNGNGTFTEKIDSNLPSLYSANISSADYNNDGLLDICINGSDDGVYKTLIFQNTGNASFIEQSSISLVGVRFGHASWGDYNNDGYTDILISGNKEDFVNVSQLYKNNGNGSFSEVCQFDGVEKGYASWGDYDNDGLLDIVISGFESANPSTKIYHNNGDNTFSQLDKLTLNGAYLGCANWVDFDNNGTLDLIVTGENSNAVTKLYKNKANFSITRPSTPTNLESLVDGLSITLKWSKSTDAETVQGGLRYDIYVYDESLTNNYSVSPSAFAYSSLNNGKRLVAKLANVLWSENGYTIKKLTKGNYKWSVQAIDNGLLGSEWAAEQSFSIEPFTEIASGIPVVQIGASSLGDYDNDGDLDVAIIGYLASSNSNIAAIYRNEGDDTFVEQTSIQLEKVNQGDIEWGDYDNDGDLDLILSGNDNGNYVTKLYRNNGDNSFTEITNVNFPGVMGSSLCWGDYDNDGDLDLLITGSSGSDFISKIFQNIGNGVFEELIGNDLIGISDGVGKWVDYDNDNDLDILISGYSYGGRRSAIYKNQGNGVFVEETNITITGLSWSSADWGDYDNDGDLDLLIAGNNSSNQVTKIYRNNGNGTFTVQSSIVLPGVEFGNVLWADFNNDGLLDIFLSGTVTEIYQNNGNNTFTKVLGDLGYMHGYSGNCGDYDEDGDIDVLFVGSDWNNPYSKIYRNESKPNIKPSMPSNLNAVQDGGDILFTWNTEGDTETPNNGLTYNLRVGTAPGGSDIISPNSLSSGVRTISAMGNVQLGTSFTLKNLRVGNYYWSVQTIDNGYRGSGFAEGGEFLIQQSSPKVSTDSINFIDLNKVNLYGTVSAENLYTTVSFEYGTNLNDFSGWKSIEATPSSIDMWNYDDHVANTIVEGLSYNTRYYYRIKAINTIGTSYGTIHSFLTSSAFTKIENDIIGIEMGTSSWADYDNDGDLDFIISGWRGTSPISKIYKNEGNDTFTPISTNITGLYTNSVAWGDYDNDGDLDFIISGYSGNDIIVTELYQNKGSDIFEKVPETNFPGLNYCSVAWGDYNNDGKLDLLLVGYNNRGPYTAIYGNQNDYHFEILSNTGLDSIYNGSGTWVDFNNDGYLDVLLSGNNEFGPLTNIYLNNRDGSFTKLFENSISDIYPGETAVADYDNDGDFDILISGYANNIQTCKLYRNDGNISFSEQTQVGIVGITQGSLKWGDYDNDGYQDILVTGTSNNERILTIYRNNKDNTFSEVENTFSSKLFNSDASWGDYDNDGDLDLLVTGNNEYGSQETSIFRNESIIHNATPETPSNLMFNQDGKDITLSWDTVTDDLTPTTAITYNVKLGTGSGQYDVVAPHALSNGKTTIPQMGNAQQGTTFKLYDLMAGTYYWSVQAIDNSFAGGAFSSEGSFFVYPSAPNVNDINVCYGNSVPDFTATGENVKWYSDGELTNLIYEGNTFSTEQTAIGTYTYYVTQTVSGSVSQSDTVTLTIHSLPSVQIVDSTNLSCYGYNDGNAIAMATGGTEPYAYSWSDGLNTGSFATNLYADSLNTVTAIDAFGCNATTTVILSQPTQIVVNSDFSSIICKNSNNGYIHLDVAGGTPDYSYNWLNTTSRSSSIDNLSSGSYQVSVTDANGCLFSQWFTIEQTEPYQGQEICLVSVNQSNQNEIIWEQVAGLGVQSYNIYRETANVGQYELIGNVASNDLSEFVDVNSNPSQRAYQYKISVVDTCGNESNLSNYHRTMHLQVGVGINTYNLSWDRYAYEGGDYVFSQYNIYRGSSQNDMQLIQSIGVNYNTFTDINPPSGLLYYQVAGVKENACQPVSLSKYLNESNYGMSFSNIQTNWATDVEEMTDNLISIYPNPSNGQLNINSNVACRLMVSDIVGKRIFECNIVSGLNPIDIQNVKSGVYIFKFIYNSSERCEKVIISK